VTPPRIAICVVTFNSAELVPDLVRSLPAGADGTDWRLVVADNASDDGTVAAVRRWAPDATIVETGANLGYAAGLNAAVRAAGDQDAYLILNADVRLQPGCLRTLHDALSADVGIAVPRLLDAEGELIWSMRRAPSVLRAWADAIVGAERVGRIPALGEVVTDPGLYRVAGPTDWAEGSTQLISAACWRAVGEWDESFFLYSEETDFDLRAGDHGLRTWYEPAAVAVHLEGGSAGSPALWSLLVVNRVRMFGRRHGRVSSGLFWAAAVAREGSRAVLGKATSRAALRCLLDPAWMRRPANADWLRSIR
jgi:GT2 family glycosyltransferase